MSPLKPEEARELMSVMMQADLWLRLDSEFFSKLNTTLKNKLIAQQEPVVFSLNNRNGSNRVKAVSINGRLLTGRLVFLATSHRILIYDSDKIILHTSIFHDTLNDVIEADGSWNERIYRIRSSEYAVDLTIHFEGPSVFWSIFGIFAPGIGSDQTRLMRLKEARLKIISMFFQRVAYS